VKQRGRRRGNGVEDDDGDGGKESAAAEETPVESRTTAGVGQRRRLPVAPAHPQIGLGFSVGLAAHR